MVKDTQRLASPGFKLFTALLPVTDYLATVAVFDVFDAHRTSRVGDELTWPFRNARPLTRL